MTYSRPGVSVPVTNTSGGTLTHGAAVKLGQRVGVVIKNKARKWSDGQSVQATIDASEKCLLVVKGVVQVTDPGLATPAAGDPVYITSANVITKTASGNTKFGVVAGLPGDGSQTPAGKVRIDLDGKDSF